AEAKLRVAEAGREGLALVAGLRHDAFELNLDVFDSRDWAAGVKDAWTSRSGGAPTIDAACAQLEWDVGEHWDLVLGGRLESFESHGGYYSADDPATPAFDLEHLPRKREDRVSPKFSLGYASAGDWRLRYSLARAWRFPIVEELFSQYEAYDAVNQANPDLAP